nr:C1:C2 [Paper mulberry leaf curling associated virus 2]
MPSNKIFAYPNCPINIPTINMSNTPQTAFRFKAKNIFLTYPNCTLHKNDVSTQLKVILHHHNITYILVCQETHASGEPHVHAMIQLDKQFETRNCRFFDIYLGPTHPEQGPTVRYHPNIEPLHSPAASQKYLKKSGNFYEDGTFNNKKRSPSKNPNAIWKDILDTSTTVQDFLEKVKEQRPQDFVLRWPAISSFANDHYKRVVEPFFPAFTEFNNLPPHIQEWANDNILFDPENKPNRPISLYICGPSRSGKTCWARSLGLHNYFTGQLKFHDYNDHALYNVIDDIHYTKISTEIMKSLVGCQQNVTVNIKYKPDRTIKGGIPTIILCNPDMDWLSTMSEHVKTWWDKNVITFYMNDNDSFF